MTNGKIIRLLVDDEPFDVRYGELVEPRARARPARRGAAARGRLGLARGPARCASARRGWSRSRSARSPRSCTRSSRVDGRRPRRRPVGAGRQRAAAAAVRRSARGGRARGRRCAPRRPRHRDLAAPCSPTDPRQRPADGGRDGPRRRGARPAPRRARESAEDVGARDRRRRPGAGRAPADREAPGLRLVEPSARCPRCATRCAAALAEARHTGWDGLLAAPARVPRRLLGAAPTSRSTATPSCSRRVRFALFHVLQAGARGRAAGDPGQGPDRARATTATPSGTPRPSCCRC